MSDPLLTHEPDECCECVFFLEKNLSDLKRRAEKSEADNARLSNLLKMAELTLKKIAGSYEQAKGE